MPVFFIWWTVIAVVMYALCFYRSWRSRHKKADERNFLDFICYILLPLIALYGSMPLMVHALDHVDIETGRGMLKLIGCGAIVSAIGTAPLALLMFGKKNEQSESERN